MGVVIVALKVSPAFELHSVQLRSFFAVGLHRWQIKHRRWCKKKDDHRVIAFFAFGLSSQGSSTSIDPSAVMLTWLVPASTSGVTGAPSMLAAFIIIGARM